MGWDNKVTAIAHAIAKVKSGDRVMVGGFGLRGCPDALIDALVETDVHDLTIISNDLGSPHKGLGKLLDKGMVKACIGSIYNWNRDLVDAHNRGEIEVTLIPQGTLAEAIRAQAYGIPAFYTPTAYGTDLAEGHENRIIHGRGCILQEAIGADVALVRAFRADRLGNLVFRKTARNFNPDMAMAADYTIAFVDEVVDAGKLDPEAIHVPHIYVDAIVTGE